MKKIIILLVLFGQTCNAQTSYIINTDTLVCLTPHELDLVIGGFIDRDMYQVSFDTLSIGFDAAMNANSELEAVNKILTNDLEMSKVISQSCEAEKIEVEKQLKKKVRQNKFKSGLVYAVTGIAIAMFVLYLVK